MNLFHRHGVTIPGARVVTSALKFDGRFLRSVFCTLGLLCCLLLGEVQAYQDWPVKKFKVYFGERGDFFETPQAFTDFTDAQVRQIETLLGQAAGELEGMGFPPPRISDTLTLDDGAKAYKVFLYEYDGAPARYLVVCEGEEGRPRIDLNAASYLEGGKISQKAFSDTVHELVHSVTRGTELYKDECEIGLWLGEGLAEAIGHDIARVLVGSNVEKRGTNRALMRWGGRDYSAPLYVKDRSTPARKDLAYQTSSFWRYLAELTEANMTGRPTPGSAFHETDYSYAPRILARTLPGKGEKAELEWLDEALKADPAIGVGLGEVYPAFIAAMSGYGERIDSALPEAEVTRRWLKTVFKGCHMVGLSPSSPDSIRIEMGLVTSECIDIRISRRSGRVPVRVTAKHKSPSLLSQVSMANLGDNQALRAQVDTSAPIAAAAWSFSVDASGPSYLVISNVAGNQPHNTRDVTVDLTFTLAAAGSNLRSQYEALLPPMPTALRIELLSKFDMKTSAEQQKLIDQQKTN